VPLYVLWTVLITAPDLALAIIGLLLFRRERTVATTLVALGFTAVVASYVLEWADMAAITRFQPWVFALRYWALIAGRFVGVAGLLWHTLRVTTASPNNRWRGP
jgi:hypothetical protein